MKTEKKRRKLGADSEIPTRASEILLLDLDYKDGRYDLLRKLKDTIQDEVAMARCLARRGLPPEESWKEDPDDPRLEAWRKTHEECIYDLVEKCSAWRHADDNVSLAGFQNLRDTAKRLYEVASLVIAGHEARGVRS